MSYQPRDPDFAAKVRDSFARQGAMAHLGVELVAVEPGMCELALPFRDEVSQQHGYFHGGIIGTVADVAGGYAAFSVTPPDTAVLTVEYKINLVAPGRGERIVARGTVLRPGRTLIVTRADVHAVEGRTETLCATMQQTIMTLPAHAGRPAG